MRAEFFRPEDPEEIVGVAHWEPPHVRIEAEGELRDLLGRVFRASPVAVEDPALRPRGSNGAAVVEPGDLEWFRAAAGVRGEREGLSVRFATESPGGWDPAGAYRPMPAWMTRNRG